MTNKDYAKSLRLIADFYEANDDIPNGGNPLSVYLSLWDEIDKSKEKEKVRQVALALGECEKTYISGMFCLKKVFHKIELSFVWSREAVCERKVVGFKEIPESYYPARQEEIIEWECKSILSKEDADALSHNTTATASEATNR